MNFIKRTYVNKEGVTREVLTANIAATLESDLNPTEREGLYVCTISFTNAKGATVKRSALVHQGMIDYSESNQEYSRPFVVGNQYAARVDVATELDNSDPNKVAITLGCIEPGGSRATMDDFGLVSDEIQVGQEA